ncbi:hypothetical protein DICPUDRAFT_82594 [Dictyostelium purpureum]|uniref:Uncharacterized protein n=1 Tax=Dictyostelium purpureum TaxID=5786 RepID=F0ZWZ9_DICPU|nr:uncharacterized protein DICPUDRAFT_82594 [Dictyostelium purpureum]EGC31537.1 hypothetical protein DICPUDRAFT_82594 [Dictyostelium purpureum]|eukprot:XP_003291937.1 hypothetical protein DICPUDRAFT_82594 [Dictyostelium purpureum]
MKSQSQPPNNLKINNNKNKNNNNNNNDNTINDDNRINTKTYLEESQDKSELILKLIKKKNDLSVILEGLKSNKNKNQIVNYNSEGNDNNNSNNNNNNNNNNNHQNKINLSTTMKELILNKTKDYSGDGIKDIYDDDLFLKDIKTKSLFCEDIITSSKNTQEETKSHFFQLYGISVYNNNSKWLNLINFNSNKSNNNNNNNSQEGYFNHNHNGNDSEPNYLLFRFDTYLDNKYYEHYLVNLFQDNLKGVIQIANHNLPYWIPIQTIADKYLVNNNNNIKIFCELIQLLLNCFIQRREEYNETLIKDENNGYEIIFHQNNESYTHFQYKILYYSNENILHFEIKYENLAHHLPSKLIINNSNINISNDLINTNNSSNNINNNNKIIKQLIKINREKPLKPNNDINNFDTLEYHDFKQLFKHLK